MKRRSGFTLVELIIAIVLAGIIALLAYGSLQAGIDSTARLERQRSGVETEAMMRTFVSDALRHPADASDGGPSFTIARSGQRFGDQLQFTSRGVSGPLGAGELWRVTVASSAQGIDVSASSLDGNSAPIRGLIPTLSSLSVRVLGSPDEKRWQASWESTRQFPSAVEISFRDSAGRQAGVPLLASTGLGAR